MPRIAEERRERICQDPSPRATSLPEINVPGKENAGSLLGGACPGPPSCREGSCSHRKGRSNVTAWGAASPSNDLARGQGHSLGAVLWGLSRSFPQEQPSATSFVCVASYLPQIWQRQSLCSSIFGGEH